jgi:hypothetical protein
LDDIPLTNLCGNGGKPLFLELRGKHPGVYLWLCSLIHD